jgi:hypothetical protein
MKRIIRIEVCFEDRGERGQRATPAARQATNAAKLAAKSAAVGVINSMGFRVTETSSSSTAEDIKDQVDP